MSHISINGNGNTVSINSTSTNKGMQLPELSEDELDAIVKEAIDDYLEQQGEDNGNDQ